MNKKRWGSWEFVSVVFWLFWLSMGLIFIKQELQETNKQLKHIVQIQEQQTTTPELIIEENTLGGSNAK